MSSPDFLQTSTKQLIKLWHNMKKSYRDQKTAENVSIMQTGGGPTSAPAATPRPGVSDLLAHVMNPIQCDLDSDEFPGMLLPYLIHNSVFTFLAKQCHLSFFITSSKYEEITIIIDFLMRMSVVTAIA